MLSLSPWVSGTVELNEIVFILDGGFLWQSDRGRASVESQSYRLELVY